MSNDTKFWAFRIAVYVMLTLDTWLLFKGVSWTGEVKVFWLVLFGIGICVNIPLYVYYRKLKKERWAPTAGKTQEQIEVETLAAYAAQERADKARGVELASQPSKEVPKNPPPSQQV